MIPLKQMRIVVQSDGHEQISIERNTKVVSIEPKTLVSVWGNAIPVQSAGGGWGPRMVLTQSTTSSRGAAVTLLQADWLL